MRYIFCLKSDHLQKLSSAVHHVDVVVIIVVRRAIDCILSMNRRSHLILSLLNSLLHITHNTLHITKLRLIHYILKSTRQIQTDSTQKKNETFVVCVEYKSFFPRTSKSPKKMCWSSSSSSSSSTSYSLLQLLCVLFALQHPTHIKLFVFVFPFIKSKNNHRPIHLCCAVLGVVYAMQRLHHMRTYWTSKKY